MLRARFLITFAVAAAVLLAPIAIWAGPCDPNIPSEARIVYSGWGCPGSSPGACTAGLDIHFMLIANNVLPDVCGSTYQWFFGDHTSIFGSSPSADHAYATAGSYVVRVLATNPNGSALFEQNVDVDNGRFAFEHDSFHADESNGSASISVFRTNPLGTATVQYATSDGTAVAGVRYVATSGTLTFGTGDVYKTITVPLIADSIVQGPQQFQINLSSPSAGYTLMQSSAAVTVDDEAPPTISIPDVSVSEGNGPEAGLTFGITLSRPLLIPLEVRWATKDDTAVAGRDYGAASGVVVFAPGDTSSNIGLSVTGDKSIPIYGDTIPERDRTFQIIPSIPCCTSTAYPIRAGTCTILNDDVSVSPRTQSIAAGTHGFIGVNLGQPPDSDQTIAITTSDPRVAQTAPVVTVHAGTPIVRIDVAGISHGTATIAIALPPSLGGQKLQAGVGVYDAASLQLDPPRLRLFAGATAKVVASIAPLQNEPVTVALSCVDASIATVPDSLIVASGGSGVFTVAAGAAGSTFISATLSPASGGATITLPVDVLEQPEGVSVSGVTPTFGSTRGGTLVSILGARLQRNCWAFFGDAAAHGVNIIDANTLVAATPAHIAGTATVSIRCGTEIASLPGAFTFTTADDPSPVIASFDPISGAPGESVHLRGTRFRTTDRVSFDATPATILSTTPDTQTVRVPDVPPGRSSITLVDVDGHITTTGPAFAVLEPQLPRIDSVSPAIIAAGHEIEVTGSGFRPALTFVVGDRPASVVELSFTHAIVRVGAVDPGTYPIELADEGGATVAVGPLLECIGSSTSITAVTPMCGPSEGGTLITITGNSFAAGAAVTFDGIGASEVAVVDAHTIRAKAPAGTVGYSRIVVTNPDGTTGSLSDAFRYYSTMDPDGGCAAPSRRRPLH